MLKIYNVIHIYDVDGGFGDAIPQQETLFTTLNKSIAKCFVEKYSNDHIYDNPYADLHCGKLVIKESDVIQTCEDIPQEIIKWGIKNIEEKYVDPYFD